MSEVSIFSVDTLLKYMGNDDKARAMVGKIVADACAPGMQPLLLAGTAIREGRLTDAGKMLHTLRGAIGTLGAKRLVSASLELEQALLGQHTEQIPTLFASVDAEYRLVLHAAENWLRQNAPEQMR
ncbi:Hpt domain-containing protein [Pseudoduganella sp. FT93W]|uniref:Hpt domain-containing protein n=1 Tax=Duganella fentianensis TaxID=2692177 RepID=A0A845HY59_9BURK|nr:Hpt domain-containing protein [Duganella fentianensis]MYN45812.1 Hpt domain-containing protein [Duganella fentianensis]